MQKILYMSRLRQERSLGNRALIGQTQQQCCGRPGVSIVKKNYVNTEEAYYSVF